MFDVKLDTMEITMHSGDTGSFWVHGERGSGAAWTEADRMLFTVRNAAGGIVMQRIYRLDDQWDAGDGNVLVEFHNDDTDTWEAGVYSTEMRFDVSPVWEGGTAPAERCADAMRISARMAEGSIVRTKIQSTLTILNVLGKI